MGNSLMERKANLCNDEFTKLSSKDITIRFELEPEKETVEMLEKNKIILSDEQLARDSKEVKKISDDYHRELINNALSKLVLENLKAYYECYNNSSIQNKNNNKKHKGNKKDDELSSISKALCLEICNCFKKEDAYKKAFRKEFINNLIEWAQKRGYSNSQIENIKKFSKNSTYFKGYNVIREKMYSDDEKSSTIAYRLINENLHRFIDNMKIFERISQSSLLQEVSALSKERDIAYYFTIDAYNDVLTQSGIDTYNELIGGNKTTEGINQIINKYNQKNTEKKIPTLHKLYNQILSMNKVSKWAYEPFENTKELLEAVEKFYEKCLSKDGIFEKLEKILSELSEADCDQIYIREDYIYGLSVKMFSDGRILFEALGLKDEETCNKKKYHSLNQIQDALEKHSGKCDEAIVDSFDNAVLKYFKDNSLFVKVREIYEEKKNLFKEKQEENYLSENVIVDLKELLDITMKLLHHLKLLYLKPGEQVEKNEYFYQAFGGEYEALRQLTDLYDKVRNFSTKKRFSTKKTKLNFGCSGETLSGWVDSKTKSSDNGTQYNGYLFRKKNEIGEYDYYLGISKNTKLFRCSKEVYIDDESEFERLDYYQIKAEIFYGKGYKGEEKYSVFKEKIMKYMKAYVNKYGETEFISKVNKYCKDKKATPSGCLEIIRDNEKCYNCLIKDEDFQKMNKAVIQDIKKTLNELDKVQDKDYIINKDYNMFTEIMKDVEVLLSESKTMKYFAVSKTEMNKALTDENKPLYLFRITNKDLSYAKNAHQRKSRGKDNLHTMYFKALMSGEQNVYDLGSGEVFFREKSIIENNTVHKKGEKLTYKNPKLKKNGKTNTFSYDIVKDRRYTVDKYQFHLSIKANCNVNSTDKSLNINKRVYDFLKNNQNINILGIDRGERNLIYISLIDRNGNVIKDSTGNYIQYSLNTITGKYKNSEGEAVTFETPYHDILDEREKDRYEARKNWKTIENIKELKSGYLSQVVHHIARLMIEYNAIVVMEDLTARFKRDRMSIDKQVYQKFEKALLEKLNYLVFKDYLITEPGGLYNALQLTDKFTAFKYLNKQSGFVFYVQASRTSKIDPVTGFVNLLKTKYTNKPAAKEFFGKFDSIRYNKEYGYFEFAFDYKNFVEEVPGARTKWTVCTHGKLRYKYNGKVNGGATKFDVTSTLKQTFEDAGIKWEDGDLVDVICRQNDADFFRTLIECLKVTLQLRYTSNKDKKDFILSPVADKKGKFYCSENCAPNLPKDADANGAYNIARKGLYVLREIDKSEKYDDWSVNISDEEWLKFVQRDLQ